MNNDNAKLILEEWQYTNGANVPTIHKECVCPCGKGKIVEDRVPAVNDWFTQIECLTCKEKFTVIEGCGHIWELKDNRAK